MRPSSAAAVGPLYGWYPAGIVPHRALVWRNQCRVRIRARVVQLSAHAFAERGDPRVSVLVWSSNEQSWMQSSAHAGRRRTPIASWQQKSTGRFRRICGWTGRLSSKGSLIESNRIAANKRRLVSAARTVTTRSDLGYVRVWTNVGSLPFPTAISPRQIVANRLTHGAGERFLS